MAPKVWDQYIGPCPHRTLRAYEAWALQGLKMASASATSRVPLVARWPSEREEHLYIYPVPEQSGSGDAGQAAVVFLAGRQFLVGAPAGIKRHRLKRRRPTDLILLSWREEHLAGLIDYCNGLRKDERLTIWTSDWVWEHVQERAQERTQERTQKKGCLHLLGARHVEEAGHSENNGSDGVSTNATGTNEQLSQSAIDYVEFKNSHAKAFDAQLELRMYYEVGADPPRLAAQFRLFDSHLTVRLESPEVWPHLPTVQQYQEVCLARIYEQFPTAREVLRPAIEARLAELADAHLARRATAASESVPGHDFSIPDRLYRYTVESRVLQDVCGEKPVHLGDPSLRPAQLKAGPDEVLGDNDMLASLKSGEQRALDDWNREHVLRARSLRVAWASPNCLSPSLDFRSDDMSPHSSRR